MWSSAQFSKDTEAQYIMMFLAEGSVGHIKTIIIY